MSKIIDRTGSKYGRLLVKSCFKQEGRTRWLCICDCGKEVVCYSGSVSSGKTRSCGCLSKEITVKRNTTHGECRTQTSKAWNHIKSRCYNKKDTSFHNYGGRGIIMDPLWKEDYTVFRDYIGHPPKDGQRYTVDRIDSNGNYEPGNVRWATYKEQAKNKRISSRNTSGVTGVSFNEGRNCYNAKWHTPEGKQKSQRFSITKYGKEEAFRLACEARENAIRELNAQGAGYTENHGRNILYKTIGLETT